MRGLSGIFGIFDLFTIGYGSMNQKGSECIMHPSEPSSCRAAGLVRMAHSAQATLFRQRMDSTLDLLASKVVRRPVATMPTTVQEHIRKNTSLLGLCNADLSEEEQVELLGILNDSWESPCTDGILQHWCPPGCCSDELVTKRRLRSALGFSLARLFAVPLLYRWKHFEGALCYTLRNIAIHNLLPFVWSACMTQTADNELLTEHLLEIDNPDLPPSLQQQVRMGKVLRLLNEADIKELRLLQRIVFSRDDFSDYVTHNKCGEVESLLSSVH